MDSVQQISSPDSGLQGSYYIFGPMELDSRVHLYGCLYNQLVHQSESQGES